LYGAAIVPSFEGLAMMKEQMAASSHVLTVIMKWLLEPLQHQGEDRSEAETVILDLSLNLIRNLLQLAPPVETGVALPASLKARLFAAQDALVHRFAEDNVLDMLVLLAQNIEDDENRNWNLLLLDIFALLIAKEDPSEVIGSADLERGAWRMSARKQELLERNPAQASIAERKARLPSRHQRRHLPDADG
jgi:hypothetical protein